MVNKIANIFSYFYNDKFVRGFKYFNRLIYSHVYSRRLKIEKGAYICPPVRLIGQQYIKIGNFFQVREGFILEARDEYGGEKYNPCIEIGTRCSIGFDCHIGAINRISIGDNVLIGNKVYISDHAHGNSSVEELDIPPIDRRLCSKGPVIIKDNVWIGDNVSVLPNVTIGKNVVIGANAVVNKNIPDNVIAAGVPAKIIKFYDKDAD